MVRNGRDDAQNGPPGFFHLMDEDPKAAFEAFYRMAVAQLRTCPPLPLRTVDAGDRLDLIHEVVVHCCRDDFRVLRSYDRRRRFDIWFDFVARNRILDTTRPGRAERSRRVEVEDDILESIARVSPGAEGQAHARLLLEKVRHAVDSLGEKCRILVLGAAEGRSPRELVRLLGWPEDANKKASDDLRACRARLRKALLSEGLTPDDLEVDVD